MRDAPETCPLAIGALNLAEALAEGKTLADVLTLCEFRNTNGHRWSLGPEGAKHMAAAVTAHALGDAAVTRGWRAFTVAVLKEEGMSEAEIQATLIARIQDTSPADLRKVETTMRAAIAAALDATGGRDGGE